MTRMTKDQIPDFVSHVVAAGGDISAVLGVGYMIGDADLTEERYEAVAPELDRICKQFGDRDHLREDITDYLISIGRVFPTYAVLEGDKTSPL